MVWEFILFSAIGLFISASLAYFGGYEWLYKKIEKRFPPRGWYEMAKKDLMPRGARLTKISKSYGVNKDAVKGHLDIIEKQWGANMAYMEFHGLELPATKPIGMHKVDRKHK
jgi:hypothetical protein